MGVAMLDVDGDGWTDLAVANDTTPNFLFRNKGNGTFEEVGRGSAFADLDGDGDLDIVVTTNGGPARLYENRGPHGHWLRLGLTGVRSNRDGIGARIEVTVKGAVQTWLVHTAGSYLSQPQVEPVFGLGDAVVADKVVIRWPSGAAQTLTNVKADQRIEVTEKDDSTAAAAP